MPHNEINPLEDWASEELSEEELDLLAGGWRGSAFRSNGADVFGSSNSPILAKQDNMFSAYDGAKGTTLDNQYSNNRPLNIGMGFP